MVGLSFGAAGAYGEVMATRAQEFRALAERSGPKRAKRPWKPKVQNANTALPGVSATDKKRGRGDTAARNVSMHAERHGGPALETSATTPSRKSTRKSVDHTKRTTTQQLRAIQKASAPKTRAARARVRARKV